MQSEKFNMNKYVRSGFDPVVELDDEVEYLLSKEAVESIQNNQSTISLVRLIDGEIRIFPIEQIIVSLEKGGVVDYLKAK
jgi:hypothetical protein